ncbi:hypothetical protein [Pseudodesulfovibrio sp.]|uniref:hypothetical protein n=1 Tax=Pseudodesulfovibrio sp. TaxID=2035812 RepID=UPI002625C736|nr:hypothetical protein [Pseudodesulfovibrio sp.]MDD3310984.1 hypothetical protein [Pseudodesulfovibrio sp.]
MELIPETSGTDTRRQTGNQSWPAPAPEPAPQSSGKIQRAILDLKGLLQRDMPAHCIERANALCNIILAEVDAVRGLETTAIIGGSNG